MHKRAPAGHDIDRRLQEALAQLYKDVRSVEIWAAALTSFTQPIPDYEPMNQHVLRARDGDRR
jgi:hypothetical protein